MKALLKKVGEPVEVVNIKNSLKDLQAAVSGHIETVTITLPGIEHVIICDEEGRLKGYQHNCFIFGTEFVGDILIVGLNRKHDDFGDANDELINFYLKNYGKDRTDENER